MLYSGSMQLRSSLKFVKLSYVLCLVLAVGLVVFIMSTPGTPQSAYWSLLPPAALLLFTAIRHVRLRLAKITITGDKLRFESGLFSKSTRSVELVKVQDVRVDQSFWQRVFNVGDLSLETAGGSSRIEMDQIDRPQEAADHILELARTQRGVEGRPPGAGV
jgi:membrane protein YdbS with pleckstrin-like domain